MCKHKKSYTVKYSVLIDRNTHEHIRYLKQFMLYKYLKDLESLRVNNS